MREHPTGGGRKWASICFVEEGKGKPDLPDSFPPSASLTPLDRLAAWSVSTDDLVSNISVRLSNGLGLL
jgi:hypothetical protein